jgi:UDP-glucose 4-epimerase
MIEVADDRPRRDFIYVSDLVDLLVATLTRGAEGVYNAGSGFSASIPGIVASLNSFIPNKKRLISRGESRPQEVLDVVADIRRSEFELEWKPRIDLETGLRLIVEEVWNRSGLTPDRHPEHT